MSEQGIRMTDADLVQENSILRTFGEKMPDHTVEIFRILSQNPQSDVFKLLSDRKAKGEIKIGLEEMVSKELAQDNFSPFISGHIYDENGEYENTVDIGSNENDATTLYVTKAVFDQLLPLCIDIDKIGN